jgi:hypothetical protein
MIGELQNSANFLTEYFYRYMQQKNPDLYNAKVDDSEFAFMTKMIEQMNLPPPDRTQSAQVKLIIDMMN